MTPRRRAGVDAGFKPSNAETTFVLRTRMQILENILNPVMLVFIFIALTEYSQMSTDVPGFQSFFRVFVSFCIGQISHRHKC